MNLKHQWYECPVGPFPAPGISVKQFNAQPSHLDRLLTNLGVQPMNIVTDGKRWGVKVMVPR